MRRVVVIDDHQPSRRHLVKILNSGGYEIAGEGASGKIALALARSAGPDVIWMAVGLPDADGIETSHDVMRAHPLPIILITSHHDAARDPLSRQPELKACAVRVRKVTVFPVHDN